MKNASLDFALSFPDIAAGAVKIDCLYQITSDLQALSNAARALLRSTTAD